MPTNDVAPLGRYLNAMEHICGYTPTPEDDASPVCGKPAVHHFWVGGPDEPHGCIEACEAHFSTAQAISYDWHAVGPVCDVPGTQWHFAGLQGEGFCSWPPAEEAVAAELALELHPSTTTR